MTAPMKKSKVAMCTSYICKVANYQMSKSWHKKRMKRMTCDDLADLGRI